MDIKTLQQERDKHTTGFFWLGLQIAVIFGLPAGIAVFVGKKLNLQFDTNIWTTIFLAAAFVISWVIVGIMYNKKSKILNKIESQIRELRKIEEESKSKE